MTVQQQAGGSRALVGVLATWMLLTAAIAGMPIVMTALDTITHDGPLTWAGVLGRGDLLLVASALCAGALGELLIAVVTRPGTTLQVKHIFTIVLVILTVTVCSSWFSEISTALRDGTHMDFAAVAKDSLYLFLFAAVNAAACQIPARRRES